MPGWRSPEWRPLRAAPGAGSREPYPGSGSHEEVEGLHEGLDETPARRADRSSTDAVDVFGVAPSTVRPPAPRPGLAPRPLLVKRMVEAEAALVAVVAPAGYDKSTLARLWLDADDRPFAWVQLGPLDDDPVHLLRHVAAALHQVEPLPEGAVRAISGPGRSVELEALPALARGLEGRGAEVLVLDDAHLVTSEASLAVLDALVDVGPATTTVALLARHRPAIPLARRRLTAGLLELGAADLAMDDGEAAELLDGGGLALDADTVRVLVDRTEGWPAGLQLAAGLVRQAGTATSDLVTGRDRVVADYLVEEVLSGLPADTTRFLERASVLDRFTAPQLDALLGVTNAARTLREVEDTTSAFLVALDHRRATYRFHHLFGEMLHDRLVARDPEEARALHLRASRRCERDGDLDAAVRHAVAAADGQRAARLAAGAAADLVLNGREALLRRWLDQLDPDAIERWAPAALAWGWYGATTGDRPLVARALESPAVGRTAQAEDREARAAAVGLATVRTILGPDGIPGVLADAERVRAAGGPDENPWWTTATVAAGGALVQDGEAAQARDLLESVLRVADAAPAIEAVTEAQIAFLDLEAGDLESADRRSRRSLSLAEHHNLAGVGATVAVFAVGALVAARQGRPEEAVTCTHATRRMLARMQGIAPRSHLFGAVVLARAALARGDAAGGRALAAEARRLQRQGVRAAGVEAQLELVEAQLGAVDDRAGPLVVPLTAAELRVLAHLPTHRSMQEIADQLTISRNTAKTHTAAIYRKLAVSSRSAAVEEARRLGYLD